MTGHAKGSPRAGRFLIRPAAGGSSRHRQRGRRTSSRRRGIRHRPMAESGQPPLSAPAWRAIINPTNNGKSATWPSPARSASLPQCRLAPVAPTQAHHGSTALQAKEDLVVVSQLRGIRAPDQLGTLLRAENRLSVRFLGILCVHETGHRFDRVTLPWWSPNGISPGNNGDAELLSQVRDVDEEGCHVETRG